MLDNVCYLSLFTVVAMLHSLCIAGVLLCLNSILLFCLASQGVYCYTWGGMNFLSHCFVKKERPTLLVGCSVSDNCQYFIHHFNTGYIFTMYFLS